MQILINTYKYFKLKLETKIKTHYSEINFSFPAINIIWTSFQNKKHRLVASFIRHHCLLWYGCTWISLRKFKLNQISSTNIHSWVKTWKDTIEFTLKSLSPNLGPWPLSFTPYSNRYYPSLMCTSGSSPIIYMQIVYICFLSPKHTHSNVSLPCFLNLIYLRVCSVSLHKERPYSILWVHHGPWNECLCVCF